MEPKKLLIKKKCKACGNSIIVKRQLGSTPAPEDCATCRSLGVNKAIEQRLSVKLKGRTELKINSNKALKKHQKRKKLNPKEIY